MTTPTDLREQAAAASAELRTLIIGDALADGRITSGILAEKLIQQRGAHATLIDQLASALPLWRPISEAPKDGTRFWGLVGDDAIAMLWHEKFGAFVASWHRMTMAPGLLIDGEPYSDHSPDVQHPIAWMPLPQSEPVPEEKEKA